MNISLDDLHIHISDSDVEKDTFDILRKNVIEVIKQLSAKGMKGELYIKTKKYHWGKRLIDWNEFYLSKKDSNKYYLLTFDRFNVKNIQLLYKHN